MTHITINFRTCSQRFKILSTKGNLAIINTVGTYTIVLVTNGLSPAAFIRTLEQAERIREKLLALAPDWADLPELRSTKGKQLREGIRGIVEGVA